MVTSTVSICSLPQEHLWRSTKEAALCLVLEDTALTGVNVCHETPPTINTDFSARNWRKRCECEKRFNTSWLWEHGLLWVTVLIIRLTSPREITLACRNNLTNILTCGRRRLQKPSVCQGNERKWALQHSKGVLIYTCKELDNDSLNEALWSTLPGKFLQGKGRHPWTSFRLLPTRYS